MEERDRNTGRGGIVALLTDFGLRDHYVGALKGSILAVNPLAVISDITHETDPHDLRSAGFALWACFRDFPDGTVFVCVVDPGVGTNRKRIIVRSAEYQFVAPDNGLLSWVIHDLGKFEAFEIVNAEFYGPRLTGTFDGRDVFGPVGAHLSAGIPTERIGLRIEEIRLIPTGLEVKAEGARRICSVVHIDRFGNIITGLPAEDLSPGVCAEIGATTISEVRNSFDEGAGAEVFLIAGSSGLVEIARYAGSAARALSTNVGDTVVFDLPKRRLTQ